MKTQKVKTIVLDLAADIVGGLFYSIGVYTFAAANSFTSGGISGLAIIINYLFNLPIGIVTVLLNLPLVVLGILKLGRKMVLKTVKSVVVISLVTDFVVPLIPVYKGNTILAAMACGIAMGAGIAIIFLRGSSTGGTDFLTLTLKKRFPHINVGMLIMSQDVIVIAISTIVFKNIDAALYGAIAIVICSKVIDAIMYGFESGSALFIVTNRPDEIIKDISACIDRSSTIVPVKGGYSGMDKTMLMVVIKKNQLVHVKRIVREYDDTAFVTALEATEIVGEGFKPHGDN